MAEKQNKKKTLIQPLNQKQSEPKKSLNSVLVRAAKEISDAIDNRDTDNLDISESYINEKCSKKNKNMKSKKKIKRLNENVQYDIYINQLENELSKCKNPECIEQIENSIKKFKRKNFMSKLAKVGLIGVGIGGVAYTVPKALNIIRNYDKIIKDLSGKASEVMSGANDTMKIIQNNPFIKG